MWKDYSILDYMIRNISVDKIMDDLISKEKYKFVDQKIIADIAQEVVAIFQSLTKGEK